MTVQVPRDVARVGAAADAPAAGSGGQGRQQPGTPRARSAPGQPAHHPTAAHRALPMVACLPSFPLTPSSHAQREGDTLGVHAL